MTASSPLTATALMALATSAATRCAERTVQCSDGVTLAARCWTAAGTGGTASSSSSSSASSTAALASAPPRRILCLHGWLDNSATFHLLGPALSSRLPFSAEIVALDLPGHGLSGHKSPDGPPQLLAEYAYYVTEFVDAIGWGSADGYVNGDGNNNSNDDDGNNDDQQQHQQLIMIGHSMGAGVATCFAAAFPELVDCAVLLEGAGPLARNADDVSRHVRDAVLRRKKGNRLLYGGNADGGSGDRSNGRARVYPSIDAAVQVRMSTARLSPGTQYISREASEAMVRRATMPASTGSNDGNDASEGINGDGSDDDGPVIFRHDPRLQWPSLQYFTREQVDALYRDVTCPVCLVTAEDGWPTDARAKQSIEDLLRPAYHVVLPGSHHFHADPDSAGRVVEEVVRFLEGQGNGGRGGG